MKAKSHSFLQCNWFFLFAILLFPDFSAKGQVLGHVVEDATGDDVPLTYVGLLNPSDSTRAAGALTDETGKFSIDVDAGTYLLHVTYMGFSPYYKSVTVTNTPLNLGKIRLKPSTNKLDEVTVEAASKLFQSDGEKRVFNVENTIVSEGGTALQVLETLPSIQVDEEGGISMRGSGDILIYINGRPTNLSGDDAESILEQYPAEVIEKVELITNPGARYDAAGVGGIINIVLKKNKMKGWNGQVNTSVGSRNKYSAGTNMNYRNGPLNVNFGYNYNYRQLEFLSESYRRNFTGTASPILDQDFRTMSYDQNHLVRVGLDYEITDKSVFSVFSNVNFRGRNRERTYNIRSLSALQEMDSTYIRDMNEGQTRTNVEAGLSFQHQFREGEKLLFMGSFARNEVDRVEFFNQIFLDANGLEVPQKEQREIFARPMLSNLTVLQLDYEKGLGGKMLLEAGLKSTLSFDDRTQIFDEFDIEAEEFERNEWVTNSFTFQEDVHAAYLTFKDKRNQWSYQAGLRGELSLTEGIEPETGGRYVNNYFDLFPSAFLAYEISENQDIRVSYSRRINRPNMWRLAPFFNVQDLLNQRFGNPNLQPEYNNNYEISYLRSWEKLSVTGALFHRTTQNAMQRIVNLRESGATVMTWENAALRENTGLELIQQVSFNKNSDVTLTTSFFNSRVRADLSEQGSVDNETFTWNTSLLGNFRIPKIMSVQVTGSYRGPIVIPQGRIVPIFVMNLGVRKDILNKRGTISLNLSDVFDTQVFRIEAQGVGFEQTRMFNRETQILTIAFTYRFKDFSDRQSHDDSRNGGDDEMF